MTNNPVVPQKICFKCGGKKPLYDFYKHPEMADGHVNKCKECNKQDVRKNYAEKREQYAAYERERWGRPERRAATVVYHQKNKANNPAVFAAYAAVAYAIRSGRLTKLPCYNCGSKRSQAHHPDYSKPLDVVWLCRTCHLAAHGKVAYQPYERRSVVST